MTKLANRSSGIVSIIFAVACYGLFGTLAKFVGTNFGAFTQNWVRNFLVVVLISIFALLAKHKWKPVEKKDIGWMLAWTLSGAFNTILLFIAFNNIPIGTAYFLLYASMIGTGFLSGKIIFKETVNSRKILALILSLLGLVIIYFLDIKSGKAIYAIFSLIAGVMVGLWNTLSKKVSDNYPNSQLVFIDSSMSAIVGALGSLIMSEPLPQITLNGPWLAILLWAVAQLTATGLVVYGFKHLEAQIASVIMPIEVIFGTLFGFIFFGQVLPITTLIGGLLIASAAAVAGYQSSTE